MKANMSRRRNVLIIIDSDYFCDRRIVTGALKGLSKHLDWSTTTLNFRNAGFFQSVRLLNQDIPFDGVITNCSVPLTKSFVDELPNAHIVSAAADTEPYSRYGCIVDNKAIANAAADALLRLGCHAFGYVGSEESPFQRFHSRERAQHFGKALQKAGHSAQSILIDDPQLERFLTELPKPAGIFAFNDRTAAALMKTIRSLRIDVPGQIAVIGVDNDPDICNNTRPPLSSVDPDFEAVGRNAIDALIAIFRNPRARIRLSAGVKDVVPRESTSHTPAPGSVSTMLNPATRKTCLPWMTLNGRGTAMSITLSTRSRVTDASVTMAGTTPASSLRIASSRRSANCSAFLSGSNGASAVENEPVMMPQTVKPST